MIIQLAPFDRTQASQDVVRESLSIPASEDGPAMELTLEGDPNLLLLLEVQLPQVTNFSVQQGEDQRSIALSFDASPTASPAENRAKHLADEARRSMTAGDIDRAILLYVSVLQLPENSQTRDAIELLGLARERNGQPAQAASQYRLFLSRYKEGDGVERVRQRLETLRSASQPERKALRSPGVVPPAERHTMRRIAPRSMSRSTPAAPRFDAHGSLSSYYIRSDLFPEAGPDRALASSQMLNLYLSGRWHSDRLLVRPLFSGTYRYDFLNRETGRGSRVSNLEVEVKSLQGGLAALIGRQSPHGSGVLNRFDGVRVAYEVDDHWEIGAVGGLPVGAFGEYGIQTNRYFIGGNGQFRGLDGRLTAAVYGIYQAADGLTDRVALGSDVRFLGETFNAVAFLDFDVYYAKLNLARLLGNWRIGEDIDLNALVERRSSPFLTTTNALIGTGEESLDDLRVFNSVSDIRDLARDRTADVTTISLGGAYRFTRRLQATGSFTVSDYSGTAAFDYDDATGFDFAYLAQLVMSDLWRENDVYTVGFHILDGDRSDIYTLFANARYPISRQLRLNPRLQVRNRANTGQPNQWMVRPGIRLDYRWRSLTFDGEFAFEWSGVNSGFFAGNSYLYQLSLGLRYDF